MSLSRFFSLGAIAAAALAAGCAVGPDYQKPAVATPADYTEAGPWKVAAPKDELPKGAWWKSFKDPGLDTLEAQATAASPTLRSAMARYDQARAIANISRAALLPNLGVNASAARERFSGTRQTQTPSTRFAYTTNSYDLPLDLSYTLDVFGQARRALEAARDNADAQGALYQNVLLGLQAAVAQNYYQLRSLYSQRDYLGQNVKLLTDALDLVQKLRKGGANSDLDVYQAEAQLAAVQANALAVDQEIADQRHALAVLVGQNPEAFTFETTPIDLAPPDVPVGLPSELLERRPDVAAAERTLAAANAGIGVAKAAFFPQIGLTAFAGFNSNDLSSLLESSSHEWAFGPLVTLPIFRGGALKANYEASKFAYEQAVEAYRQQVLVAFQQVEDGLSDARFLSGQQEALNRAVEASQKATNLSTVRYKAGLVSYSEVIDSQRSLLQDELLFTQVRTQRFVASIQLIKALGGGW
jgi:multidrug efflux system outer membrane protein